MSNIPVHGVVRTASHPAWTPVNVLTGQHLHGWRARRRLLLLEALSRFGVGLGSASVHRHDARTSITFKGDDGQMITISWLQYRRHHRGFHSGDGDSAATQMRSVDFEVPGTRQLSCVVPVGWDVDPGEVPPNGIPGLR